MKRCPECATSRPYELSDGRYKCRSCGKKFSWTSVWDSVRLSSRQKTRLLELFV
ncbi:transposase, partial [Burkholderia multivorans]